VAWGGATRRIKGLLYRRHHGPEWAGFDELRSTTGIPLWQNRGREALRYLDFFALNLYPSKDYLRVVYEIKTSRSDFLRELANPEKRTFAWDIANKCFFICPAGMIDKDEIPDGWGLIELTKSRLRQRKRAKWHCAMDMPIGFIAAIARRSVIDDRRRSNE